MLEQEQKQFTNVEQILATIKQNKDSYASNFWVPTLKRNVRFSEINTSQQKRLIKSIVDSPVYNTEFIYTLRDVLIENCIEPDVNIDSLTIIDKLLLALSLRICSIGANIDVEVVPEDGKKPVQVPINLMEVYEIAKNTLVNIEPKVIEDEMYIIECNVPTIGLELRIEKELRGINNVNVEIEDIRQLRETIGEAFISEIVKYITKVSIKTKEGNIAVTWDKFNFKDRIKVIGMFNSKLLKQIINYINTIKEEVNTIELVKFMYEDKSYERRLTIDGNFFMLS